MLLVKIKYKGNDLASVGNMTQVTGNQTMNKIDKSDNGGNWSLGNGNKHNELWKCPSLPHRENFQATV